MLTYLSLAVLLVGFACSSELKSPCPTRFEYSKQDEAGRYEGTLILQSEYTLHGVWVRVFFDSPVSDLKVLNGLAEVKTIDEEPKSILIKNRDLVLKKNEPTKISFSVAYKGATPPAVINYRLNARNVCPEGEE